MLPSNRQNYVKGGGLEKGSHFYHGTVQYYTLRANLQQPPLEHAQKCLTIPTYLSCLWYIHCQTLRYFGCRFLIQVCVAIKLIALKLMVCVKGLTIFIYIVHIDEKKKGIILPFMYAFLAVVSLSERSKVFGNDFPFNGTHWWGIKWDIVFPHLQLTDAMQNCWPQYVYC